MQLDIHIDRSARDYQPFLDGIKLELCWRANEEEGWVDVYDTDEKGDFVFLIRDKDGNIIRENTSKIKGYLPEGEFQELKTKRLYGKVELKKVREGSLK